MAEIDGEYFEEDTNINYLLAGTGHKKKKWFKNYYCINVNFKFFLMNFIIFYDLDLTNQQFY